MEGALRQKFSGKPVRIEEGFPPNGPGAFDVLVNNKIVHSRSGGGGFVDTHEKFQRICDFIEAEIRAAAQAARAASQ